LPAQQKEEDNVVVTSSKAANAALKNEAQLCDKLETILERWNRTRHDVL
jgi:hypothetical protein